MFRFVFPFTENDFVRINQRGGLEGQLKPIINEAFIFLISKLNLTWISAIAESQETDDIEIEGVKMIGQDRADGAYCVLELLNGLPVNVSSGPIVDDGWCKILTFPKLESSVLTDGPESALMQIRPEFLILSLLALLLMMHLANVLRDRSRMMISFWVLYANLFRQNIPSALKKTFSVGYIVLLLSSFLIQVLFGTFLHTERTSISSFVRTDKLDDIRKHDLKTSILDISSCSKLMENQEYQKISVSANYLYGGENGLHMGIGEGKLAMLVCRSDLYLILSALCTLESNRALENPMYLSPMLTGLLGGYFLNNRKSKKQKDRINGYI